MRTPVLLAFVAGAALSAALFSAPALVHAEGAPPRAEVRAPEQLCTRVAPSGKARVTVLARGDHAFLGRLEMDPGGRVPAHRDATEEYIHVLTGTGTITIDGVASKIQPGATVYVPANAEVRYENGKESLVALQVFAGPSPAAKYDAWTGCP